MYRKHLKEMEAKTGIKTIDHISEIPVVNAALNNVTDYYSKVKERNTLLRTSLNLAELSVKTMAFAATPIASLCKKPINSVDSYLVDKLTELEHSYPAIVKPTDQISAELNSQAKLIYNKTVQEPIDIINNFKDRTINLGTNTVQGLVRVGVDSVDAALENKFTKMFTNPVLDLTERGLDYWIPLSAENREQYHLTNGENSERTLRRIFDINNRVYRHVHQATFTQLGFIHLQLENTIRRLQTIKALSDSVFSGSKERLAKTLDNVSKNSLVSRCIKLIDKEKISWNIMDGLSKSYSIAILYDTVQMVENYLSLVKNFPVSVNGTRLRQNIEALISQLNKGSFSAYLPTVIDQLKSIQQMLLSYTNQMFQVITDNRLVQLLNAKPAVDKSESNDGRGSSVERSPNGKSNSRHPQ